MSPESSPGHQCNHKIILDNIKDQETFTYSLVLCKGHIDLAEESFCSSQISVKSNYCYLPTIEIDLKTKHFKCLLELQNQSQTYTFSYCNESLAVTILFKPRDTSLTVLPLYIICDGHDGRFQAPETETSTVDSACNRITTGSRLIQTILGDKLKDFGMKNKSFELEQCAVFYSKLPVVSALEMSQMELWYYFAREIMSSGLGSCEKKYLGFLSCSTYDGSRYHRDMKHEDLIKLVKGYVAYGGDGFALLGTGCLYTWPETIDAVYTKFKDDTLVDTTKFIDDSCRRGTVGGCFATTLGAALHELCHTFNLGHSETGIMGCDFGNTQNIFLPNSKHRFSRFHYWHNLLKTKCDYMDLSNSSLAILNYHKWFNSYSKDKKSCIYYDSNYKLVKSNAGIRAVEIRRAADGMVLKFWDFMGKVLKFSFQIPETVMDMIGDDNVVLFVEDDVGNVMTELI
ncbi:hypothetical protein RN001_012786 [Aquatica leii]|uniref:Zinc metalloproteinase n=1 Tax=Aquatica leii TaxID=1421715 RepID=A0AAN7PT76_9COLE|nr:hypothetical protein RN001_012786 [Aquatica leii]